MNEKSRISVVINTYNAEEHLERVIDSVKGFDEVLVCDMESTDRTLDIARSHDCRIITFERKHYNIVEPAREYAIHQAEYDWVLVVDADELVTPELKDYLYRRINTSDCPDGLFIPRKNYFMGRFLHCHYPDYILRFIRKDKTQIIQRLYFRSKINKGIFQRLYIDKDEITGCIFSRNHFRFIMNEFIFVKFRMIWFPRLFKKELNVLMKSPRRNRLPKRRGYRNDGGACDPVR